MLKTRIFYICFWLIIAFTARADNIELKAEANRSQIYLGESFILQVKVSGITHPPEPDLSQIKNSRIKSLGSQDVSRYSITIINGRMVKRGYSGRVISYEVTPLCPGTFQAGPVTLDVKGKVLKAPGPIINVTDIGKQDMVKIMVTSSRETVLIDEPFDITLAILIQRLKGKYADIQPLFPDDPPNIDVPYLSSEPIPGLLQPDINRILNEHLVSRQNQAGIGINNLTLRAGIFDFDSLFSKPRKAKFALNRRAVVKDEKPYFEYSLSINFTPQEEGNYIFGPTVFKGNIPVQVNERGKAMGSHIFAVGPACTVRVVPPPEKGRPFSYSGAIGTALMAKASLDTQSCNVGDPITLTLDVSGQIRFKNMLPLKLSLQSNILERFTIYDSTVKTIKKKDSCTFRYTLRPNQPGSYDLPPIEISYYDLKSRSYKTITTAAIPLEIKQSTEITAAEIIGDTNLPEEKEKKEDVAKMQPAPARIDISGARPGSLSANRLFFVIGAFGPIIFILSLIGRFISQHTESWKKVSRKHHALSRAYAHLHLAEAQSQTNPAQAYDTICATIRQYFVDRLDYNTTGLTPLDVRTLLEHSGITAETINKFCIIFEEAFNAGFANKTKAMPLANICRRLRKILATIDDELHTHQSGKHRRKYSSNQFKI